jgi:hypothetical protein
MYAKLTIHDIVTEFDNISCEEALELLEKLEDTDPKFFDFQFEDYDSSFMQFMKDDGAISVCVGTPTQNGELYCRYAPYDGMISFDLLEDAIDDFFNDSTDISYFEWDHNLDDYIQL